MSDARGSHLELDELADVLAGERPDDAHLRSCGTCAERLAELAAAERAVLTSLAALPVPALPDAVAERLSAALHEEGERASDAPAPAPVVPLRRRQPTWLPAVAASLVLVLGGVLGFSVLRGPDPGADSATSAAGGESAERSSDGEASQDAAGSVPEAESGPAADDSTGTALAAPPVRTATGTDWAVPDQRVTAVRQVLTGAVAALPLDPAAPSPAGSAALERLREQGALAACLSALPSTTAPGTQTLAVDFARYAGAPALAVVQRDEDAGTLVVTVVGPGCGPADPELLLRTAVPAP